MTGPGEPVVAAPSAPPAPGRRRRGVSGTAADMIRSLGILFAVIALVWFVSGMWHTTTRTSTALPDWRAQVAALAPGAGFPVQAPSNLPAGWAVTVARLAGGGAAADWEMTVTTEDGDYIDLDQAVGSVATRVAVATAGATAAGAVQVGAATWARFTLGADERGNPRAALARAVTTTAVVLSGTGSVADQEALARALTPVS